jgi:hypothetical protein
MSGALAVVQPGLLVGAYARPVAAIRAASKAARRPRSDWGTAYGDSPAWQR